MLAEPVAASVEPARTVHAGLAKANENICSGGINEAGAGRDPDLVEASDIVEEVQANLDMIRETDLQFAIHGDSGRLLVRIIDEATGEIVREIPPKEALDLAAKLDAMIGLIFDQRG